MEGGPSSALKTSFLSHLFSIKMRPQQTQLSFPWLREEAHSAGAAQFLSSARGTSLFNIAAPAIAQILLNQRHHSLMLWVILVHR